MNIDLVPDLLSHGARPSVARTISERVSQELVIGLVGPVGSGVSTSAGHLRDILVQDFAYNVCSIIKPSDFIRAEAHRVDRAPPPKAPLDVYISEMQTIGNLLREKFGGNYLAEKAVESIVKFRIENDGVSDTGILLPGRRAYIIDSIKNPEELDLLKTIYGDSLCVVGVFAPDGKRTSRLIDDGIPPTSVKKLLDRDQGEVATFGQKTRKVSVDADFFVCNDRKKDELRSRIGRFLDLLFDTAVHTPTKAECAMYEATSASANSACMSRQVGAAIVSQSGELVAIGWNDVPKFGRGLYKEDDQSVWDDEKKAILDKDNRCFKWDKHICHNETRRTGIVEKLARTIANAGVLKKGKGYTDVHKLLSGSEIDSLIEFSRSMRSR